MDEVKVDEMRELLAKATPGDWCQYDSREDDPHSEGPPFELFINGAGAIGHVHKADDAALIVEAINSLPALLDTLARLREENARLVADLAKFDWEVCCEGCNAPLFDGDDFATGPEDGCSGCWAAMTDLASRRERPCYAYRVGKACAGSAVDVDALTGCADDQAFADCDAAALSAAARAALKAPSHD